MPELPEVESVARSLRPRLVGRRVLSVELSGLPLRRAIDAARLRAACEGAEVLSVRRLGKYLLVDLSTQHTLLAHLGMSGQLRFAPAASARLPHTHALFHLDGALDLRYVDPRRFGVLCVYASAQVAASPELSILGPDPLEASFTVDYLWGELQRAHRDLKGFLLDQTKLAGLGNIYVCEALHLAGITPRRRTHRLGPERARRLHRAIRAVLLKAIRNRGTSFSDYVDAEGTTGSNFASLRVYGRQGAPCRVCKRPIRRMVQGARSTYYCPTCQV